jgi:hypothetical protein
MAVALAMSLASAFTAYHVPTGEVWRIAFGKDAWKIEFARTILLFVGSVYLLFTAFDKQRLEFHRPIERKFDLLNTCRILLFVITFLGIFVLLWHHYYGGPEGLSKNISGNLPKNPQTSINLGESGYFENYQLPYLIYFPYSFINFLIFGLPAVIVGAYASIKNILIIRDYNKKLIDTLNTMSENAKPEDIKLGFVRFCLNFINIMGEYSGLFLTLTVLLVFEDRYGKYTQSQAGLFWTWTAYFLISASLLCIFSGFTYYSDGFKRCSQYLLEKKVDPNDFQNENGVAKIFSQILNRHLSLYLTCAVLIFVLGTRATPLLKLFGLPL